MGALDIILGLLAGLGSAVAPVLPLILAGASIAVWRAANAFRRYLNP